MGVREEVEVALRRCGVPCRVVFRYEEDAGTFGVVVYVSAGDEYAARRAMGVYTFPWEVEVDASIGT